MVKFKTKLTLKNYLRSNHIRIKNRMIVIFGLAYLSLLLIISLILSWDEIIPILLGFLVFYLFYLFITPVIRFLYAKYYYKADAMEYFFDKTSFGYSVAGTKVEFKKSTIKEIMSGKDHIIFELPKQRFIALGESKDIAKAQKMIKAYKY